MKCITSGSGPAERKKGTEGEGERAEGKKEGRKGGKEEGRDEERKKRGLCP